MTVATGETAPARRLTVDTLDVLTDVHVDDPALAGTLSGLLAAVASTPSGDPAPGAVEVRGHGPFEVLGDGYRAVVGDRAAALGHALAAVNLRATSATPLLACHSAVLARGGVGLVVPAASGSGKSTLTAALLQHGWAYGSDEALGLTWDEGLMVRYPRPMALSPWSAQVTGTTGGEPGVDETFHLPASRLAAPVPVGHVVLLERGGEVPELHPLHRATGLVELMRRSFTHHRDPGAALVRWTELLRASSCWRLTLGHPVAAARLLTNRLGV